MDQCLACGSPNIFLLGNLGNITWYRCRDCGIDLREINKKVEIDLED